MVLKRVKQQQISFGYCDTRTGQRVYPPPPVEQMSDLLPEQVPPTQSSSKSNIDDVTNVSVTCHPPLAQATTIARNQDSVAFTVLLERPGHSPSATGTQVPQVCVWHNHNGQHEWQDLQLKPISGNGDTLLVTLDASEASGEATSRTWFGGELTGMPKHGHAVNFTLKWRVGTHSEWNWIKDRTGLSDGQLLYQSCRSVDLMKHKHHDFSHFFVDTSSDIAISTEQAETPHTLLYSLTCEISPAKGEDSGYSYHRIGKPLDGVRWFALVRLWAPWLAPRHGLATDIELDKDGILWSFLRQDGMHVVCLAISGIDDVLTTFISKRGNVEISGRNDRETSGTSRVLVAVADNFERANCAVMYHARKVIAQQSASSPAADEITSLMQTNFNAQWMEEWYDGLAYCTWNGLGQDLTADKILNALADLRDNNINITNLIIDDNWQSLSKGGSQFKRGFSEFEANPSGFPNGMKSLTDEIRETYPNIEHIAVWHAILGYWGGIDPDGKIAETYKTIEVVKGNKGPAAGTFTVVAPEDAKRFYDDFYAFLAASGVDGVKTDAQFFLDMLAYAPDRRAMIQEYQDAWTLAHLRHLNSRAISCMSQFPQAIFHSQLPQNKPTLLLRNSDDFFPDVEASHAWHIFCNAHNSLFNQHLNALPDWDMFQTSHDWAAFHAAARCVSGGPIYFTDKPGEHDIELIGQMTAQTVRGKTIILRPSRIGRSMEPYNPYDSPEALLKVGTYFGTSEKGSGIIGVFNVGKKNLREFVALETFPGTEEGEYIIGSFRLRELSRPMKRGSSNAFAGVEMGRRGWDILTAYPSASFTMRSASKPVQIAILGLLNKMTGIAAVTESDTHIETNGRLRISVSLKALGVFGIWFSDLDERSVKGDFMVTLSGNPVPLDCVRKSESVVSASGLGAVLEIDVAKAWKESGEEPGWENEIDVEIFMN